MLPALFFFIPLLRLAISLFLMLLLSQVPLIYFFQALLQSNAVFEPVKLLPLLTYAFQP